MITTDGYDLIQYPKENRIVIVLPQTASTMTNTVAPVSERKYKLTAQEEVIILTMVKHLFEVESE